MIHDTGLRWLGTIIHNILFVSNQEPAYLMPLRNESGILSPDLVNCFVFSPFSFDCTHEVSEQEWGEQNARVLAAN